MRNNGNDIIFRKGDINPEEYDLAIEAREIACDIETSGLDWKKDIIATCQISILSQDIIIVKISENIPDRLCALLQDENIRKIFHYAMFDLRFISYKWNVEPRNIVCTKIASKLLDVNKGNEHSLKSILMRYLSVEIDKSERLSDWTSRDLSREQLTYAAKDVMYLHQLFSKLEKELQKKSLLELAYSCYEHIPTRVCLEINGYDDIFLY